MKVDFLKIMTLLIFFFTLCQIVYSDLTKRKIFNLATAIVFLLGSYLIFIESLGFSKNYSYSFASFFIFFLFFLSFYIFGLMGAGDVKYGSVLAFCFGGENFLIILIFSLMLSFFYSYSISVIEKYGFKNFYFPKSNEVKFLSRRNIPYGAFLSMASIFHILKQAYL
ncbi:MAG: prepilin peptidase [Comamonas sp.]